MSLSGADCAGGWAPAAGVPAADPAQASTIEVQSGGELTGIDFELERQQPRRIRGRVVDQAGQSQFASGRVAASFSGSPSVTVNKTES